MTTPRQFKPITKAQPSDAEIEAFADRRGIPSIQPVKKSPQTPSQAISATPAQAGEDQATTRLAFEVPLYLADQLKLQAVKGRCSTRFLILRALEAAGYDINDIDMIADGRRLRR